jgi:hypothetical protein
VGFDPADRITLFQTGIISEENPDIRLKDIR